MITTEKRERSTEVHKNIKKQKFDKGSIKRKDDLANKPGQKFKRNFKDGKSLQKPTVGNGDKNDWRKFKEDKKQLKLKRKKAKDIYEISVEAKQIYEKLKYRYAVDKKELVEKLYNIVCVGDTLKKMVMAHDTARVIQCMLKRASPALRDEISEKLLPFVVDMCISKYSHFCVLRMFKYGSPKIKSKIVDSFMGNIVKLASYNMSNSILDQAYLTVASPQQKLYMRQEFYGELYRQSKDPNIKCLADAYKDTPNMKMSILGSVKSNIEHIANKHLVDNSLVHVIILEYLNECDEDKIEECVSTFASYIPMMLTTEEGTRAAIICFYKSNSKNRRAIIKNIKEHLVKICTHEQGHVFMIALLNSLDDTKATKKAIFDHIYPELKTLIRNQWGRRVMEWFISPADTHFYHPLFISQIEEGLKYGKKDKDVRRKEIFEQIEEPITTSILEDPNFWLSNKHIGLLTCEVLKTVNSANFVKAATALAPVVTNPAWTVVVVEPRRAPKKMKCLEDFLTEAAEWRKKKKTKSEIEHQEWSDDSKSADENSVQEVGIEEAGMHVVLKKIIKNDKERCAKDPTAPTFGSILLHHITSDTLKKWVTINRACFILLNILENNNEQTQKLLTDLLLPHLSIMKDVSTSGSELLLKKMQL